jgi:hypothetical protein
MTKEGEDKAHFASLPSLESLFESVSGPVTSKPEEKSSPKRNRKSFSRQNIPTVSIIQEEVTPPAVQHKSHSSDRLRRWCPDLPTRSTWFEFVNNEIQFLKYLTHSQRGWCTGRGSRFHPIKFSTRISGRSSSHVCPCTKMPRRSKRRPTQGKERKVWSPLFFILSFPPFPSLGHD